MPGGESTSAMLRQVQAALAASQADLTQAEQERDEAVRRASDLEQVRGELKQLRLLADGYLEDIQHLESGQDEVIDSLRSQRDLARAELASTRGRAHTSVVTLSHEVVKLQGQLAAARAEIAQLLVEYGQARDALDREKSRRSGCPNPITEGAPTMTTTNPGGEGGSTPTATADLMITAAAEAIWPELKSWAQDAYEDTDNIRGWVAAGIAAALRVMADEIEVEPSFPMTAGLAAELIRERAEGLTA
jgi:hypothetical protein